MLLKNKPLSLGFVLIFASLLGCDTSINNEEGEAPAPSATTPITTIASPTPSPTSTPTSSPTPSPTVTPTPSDLAISPTSVTLALNATASFSATGGSAPYTFERIAGVGSIASDGTYTAGATAGTALIRLTDSVGSTALASALVYAPLQITPGSHTLAVNDTLQFAALQGVPPYTYSVFSGTGAINATSGLYTAPGGAGSAVVRVTDSQGAVANASVTINPALSITPSTIELAVNNNTVFAASGGVPPYSFATTSGSVSAMSGIFTAPGAAGVATVTVSDAAAHSASATVTVRAALSLSPGSVALAPSNSETFAAAGGVPPYTYSVAFGGGTIDADSGLYTAPGSAGTAVIRVADSLGNAATAAVTINPPLAISPTAADLGVGGQKTFSGSGGVAPYSFSVVGAGTINATTGLYTAPGSFGTDTVVVTDSRGNTSSASVATSGGLNISPETITVATSNAISFTASGGVGPYTFAITGGGGSIVAATGQYTAPALTGTATIEVTDAALSTRTATVTVNPALAISPTTLLLSVNNSETFAASGGVGAHTFSVESGGGSIDPSTGAFTAPANSGTTVVAVTDDIGNVSRSTVTVSPALAVTPSTKYAVINTTAPIVPTGGVPPYSFEITAGPGTIHATSGDFTAPAATGQTTTIRVTDAKANTTLATAVSVKPLQVVNARISTCARMDNGTVQCWGANDYGQLGNGTLKDSPYPGQVTNVANVVSLAGATGGDHFCALIADGTIRCWGENSSGQIGSGSSGGAQSVAASVTGISTAVAISTGSNYSCALLADATVKCWGANSSGQFGNGVTTSSSSPVVAGGGLSGITQISTGSTHTCVLLADHTARCWGSNASGQLGNGTTSTTATPTPQVVPGLSNISDIQAGGGFTCAIDAGVLHCWGEGGNGHLALGSTTDYSTPQSTGLTGITKLKIGYYTSCAVFDTPALKCWGDSATGNIGDGATADRTLPVSVTGLTTAVDLATNGALNGGHTCALQASGALQCWGYNSNGQLGIGSSHSVPSPTSVTSLPLAATAVAVGASHTCALLSDKTLRCWGKNNDGQLGDGTSTNSLAPVNPGLTDVLAIDAGYAHTCALLTNRTMKCWGYNTSGQLGDGTTVGKTSPVSVSGLADVFEMRTGYFHTCARTGAGAVNCWGYNNSGQLGDNSTTSRNVPTPVLGVGGTVIQLAAGKGSTTNQTTCALLDTGLVRCWGENADGQLGNGNQTDQWLPTEVAILTGGTRVATSGLSSCAAMQTGEISCWGANAYGQLGNGSLIATTLANTTVVSLSQATQLAMGQQHSCALLLNGKIHCWGLNTRGEVGRGAAGGYYPGPVLVQDPSTFVSVQAASQRTCALTDTGAVKCWGLNFYGESGNGVYGGDRLTPMNVLFR